MYELYNVWIMNIYYEYMNYTMTCINIRILLYTRDCYFAYYYKYIFIIFTILFTIYI